MPLQKKVENDWQFQNEIEELITDLRSTLITKRLKAVKELGRRKTPLAAEPVGRILSDRSKEVRCAAVEALSNINPPDIVQTLVRSAEDKSADVRLRVAHALATHKSDQAVGALMKLLKDPRDEVAQMAATSLSKNPATSMTMLLRLFADKSWKLRSRSASAIKKMGKKAGNILKTAANDSDPNIRFWAIICLGPLRDKDNTSLLLEKLQDKSTSVRIAALRALRETGDPDVAGRLFDALSQPSEQVRDLIYDILKDFGSHSIPCLMESLSSEYWMGRSLAAQALSEMGSEAVMPLVSSLESQDKEKRYWAIKILGKMRETSALPEIKRFLSDSDPEIRIAALESVANFQVEDVVPQIIERFVDPIWIVRKHACEAAIRFKTKAVPHLLKALGSIEEDVRYWSLKAIASIKPPNIHNHLIRLFKDTSWTIRKTTSEVMGECGEEALVELTTLAADSTDSEVRYWVLRSLGKIGSEISLPLLFKALDDPSESIRDASQRSLASYGNAIFDDLFSLFKTDKRLLLESVCSTYKRMSPDLVVNKLCKYLGKYDEHVNYWIRRVLSHFATEAIELVTGLLESRADEVRRQAILLLGKIGSSDHAELILERLKDEYWPARIAAASTLGEIGGSESVLSLCEALEDDDEDLAMAAIISLGKIGDEKSVPVLISSLNRESWALKYQSIKILGEMKVNRAFTDLIRLLDEDTLDLKPHLIRALSKLTHPKCFQALLSRFEKEKELESRTAYILAFAELKNKKIIPHITKLAQKDNILEERRVAIKALGILEAHEAKDILMKAIKDKEPIISREALTALEKILPPDQFKKTEGAIRSARKKLEKFKYSFNEGMRQMRLGAMQDAEKHLKEAINLNAKAPYVYSALGNLYYKTGKLIDATRAYQMATKLNPGDITLSLNLGMVFFRRRAWSDAAGVFVKVFEQAPKNSQQRHYARKMLNKIKLEK